MSILTAPPKLLATRALYEAIREIEFTALGLQSRVAVLAQV